MKPLPRLAMAAVALSALSSQPAFAQPADPAPALAGAWIAQDYTPKSGVVFPFRGQIQFTGDRWSLTYIVLQDGKAQRSFAQVGSYTASGNSLSLYGDVALYPYAPAVEGLWEQPQRFVLFDEPARQKPVSATYSIDGDRLVLTMGSGSRLAFRRAGH